MRSYGYSAVVAVNIGKRVDRCAGEHIYNSLAAKDYIEYIDSAVVIDISGYKSVCRH